MNPEIDLAAPTPSPQTHKVTLAFVCKQNGELAMDQTTNYYNCSDKHVATIRAQAVDMAAFLGAKGPKPKDQSFNLQVGLKVDDQPDATGTWDGLSREAALGFERHVLNVWLHGNEQSALANKALGKI